MDGQCEQSPAGSSHRFEKSSPLYMENKTDLDMKG